MSSKYKTIIWDWNGTLLDDIELCVNIANQLLQNHNSLQLDITHYREVFGFPITEYYRKIGMDFQKESFEALTKKFIATYSDQVRQCALHSNVRDILSNFQTRAKQQYILTAAHKEMVLPLLDFYSISDYFIEIEGLDNHRAESKVHRGLQLLENNQLEKETAVLIGDTIHDYEVAHALGVDCILIANGHQSKTRLLQQARSAIPVIDTLSQLQEIV